MKPALARLAILLLLFPFTMLEAAQPRGLFADDFDPPSIEPLFLPSGGSFVLPDGPTAGQLEWLIAELAANQTTTIAEVQAHFAPSWLSQISATQTVDFINSIRASYPNAKIRDVVALTPMQATVVIATPGSAPPWGYLNIMARYTGQGQIYGLGVNGWGGSTLYPADQNLTLIQAADKFATLSSAPGLLVGRIGANGQCTALAERNANTPRALGSIWKLYALGGVGRMIADGTLFADDPIPMVASEMVLGSTINEEPVGTVFSVGDLATLMMGISDNTATDLLHERAGRVRMNQAVSQLGMAQPNVLTPLLSINEQFHLFRSFDLATSLAYVNGNETYQQQFLDNQIVPMGPQTAAPYFHIQLLTSGSWSASAFDICRAFAALRQLPPGSEALATVDAALGAGVAQPNVRGDFQRVWYKGGSLAAGTNDNRVLTHAWMLEDAGEAPYVVIALSNNPDSAIDSFLVQSVTGRLLELVAQRP